MSLPLFWRRASFSVAETAEIIGVTEDCVRGWLARNPEPDFNGVKQDGRIWLSAQDGFYYMLVASLTRWGVPVRRAMLEAAIRVNDIHDAPPKASVLVVTNRNGAQHFEPSFFAEYGPEPTLAIPIRDLFDMHLERCGAVFERDAR